jgi:hypothetical protein
MVDDPFQLSARANWCRRLARDCGDESTRSSLKDLAAEFDDRARKAGDQA